MSLHPEIPQRSLEGVGGLVSSRIHSEWVPLSDGAREEAAGIRCVIGLWFDEPGVMTSGFS